MRGLYELQQEIDLAIEALERAGCTLGVQARTALVQAMARAYDAGRASRTPEPEAEGP